MSRTFPEVHRLEHVRLDNAVLLGGSEELGDLLHLFEGHGGAGDLLDGLVPGEQAVDQFAQHLREGWQRGHGATKNNMRTLSHCTVHVGEGGWGS